VADAEEQFSRLLFWIEWFAQHLFLLHVKLKKVVVCCRSSSTVGLATCTVMKFKL
jgi:hypothetical protein